MKKLCISLSQCFFAESAVIFSVNLAVLTAFLFFDFSASNIKFTVCSIDSIIHQNSSATL